MKHLKTSLLLLFFTLYLVICVSAYNDILSPAIDIIKNKTSFVKSGTVQSDVIFTAEDFDNGFGIKVKEITIQTLPPVKDGILKVAGTAAVSGQVVPREKISTMKFVPNAKSASRCDFIVYHSGDSKTALKCTVSLSEGINFSPAAVESTFSTISNISLIKNLSAYDPENDTVCFEIVSAPKNGILTLSDTEKGSFIYRPKADFCGNDSFEYRVCDSEGNFSESEKVKIKVEKNTANLYFADMVGHWAHNSAVKTVSRGIMSMYYNEKGYAVFNPEQNITREQFLVSAMKTVNYKTENEAFSTVFSDDKKISQDAKCYVYAAYRDSVITGYNAPVGTVFDPDGEITRAQASVIVSKLINPPLTDAKAVFADTDEVPAWASDAIASLISCGIINGMDNGSINASAPLTRAQCAEMLCAVEEYLDKAEKESGFFAKLFGKK